VKLSEGGSVQTFTHMSTPGARKNTTARGTLTEQLTRRDTDVFRLSIYNTRQVIEHRTEEERFPIVTASRVLVSPSLLFLPYLPFALFIGFLFSLPSCLTYSLTHLLWL